MKRKVHLKIRLDPGQTIGPLTADKWEMADPPEVTSPDVEVKRTFESDDEFIKAMLSAKEGAEKGLFTVRDATLKDLELTFYHRDEADGAKIAGVEALLAAVVSLVSETLAVGGGEPQVPAVHPEPTVRAETGETAIKPKPAEAPAPPAPQELMTGVPEVPTEVWNALTKPDAEAMAKTLIEKATAFETDRKDRAAWAPTRENALLAHVADDTRAELAMRLLEEAGGLTTEQVEARKTSDSYQRERVRMLGAGVGVTDAIIEQLKRWTALSQEVVPLLRATTAASAVLILVCLYLVFTGHLNGTEMAVLAFVFTLAAVSPATLLLVGRPLKGLDQWSPAGAKADEAPPKPDATAPKPDAGGKPPAGKTTEAPKPGS